MTVFSPGQGLKRRGASVNIEMQDLNTQKQSPVEVTAKQVEKAQQNSAVISVAKNSASFVQSAPQPSEPDIKSCLDMDVNQCRLFLG
ncbi:MAG: hypothetical protein WCW01_00120 [Gammaproteobacteria bacterium]